MAICRQNNRRPAPPTSQLPLPPLTMGLESCVRQIRLFEGKNAPKEAVYLGVKVDPKVFLRALKSRRDLLIMGSLQ